MDTVLMARSDLHRRELFESECVICFGINIDRQQVVSVIFHVGTCRIVPRKCHTFLLF